LPLLRSQQSVTESADPAMNVAGCAASLGVKRIGEKSAGRGKKEIQGYRGFFKETGA
jgi:hypothetical protein